MKRRGFFSAIIGSALAACGVGAVSLRKRTNGFRFHYGNYSHDRETPESLTFQYSTMSKLKIEMEQLPDGNWLKTATVKRYRDDGAEYIEKIVRTLHFQKPTVIHEPMLESLV